jgi:hypothetical protein
MTVKQAIEAREVAAAFERGRTLVGAAGVLGVHRTTLWRWLDDDAAFLAEVRGWRRQWAEEARAAAAARQAEQERKEREREATRQWRLDAVRFQVAEKLVAEMEAGNIRVLLWLAKTLGVERALAGMRTPIPDDVDVLGANADAEAGDGWQDDADGCTVVQDVADGCKALQDDAAAGAGDAAAERGSESGGDGDADGCQALQDDATSGAVVDGEDAGGRRPPVPLPALPDSPPQGGEHENRPALPDSPAQGGGRESGPTPRALYEGLDRLRTPPAERLAMLQTLPPERLTEPGVMALMAAATKQAAWELEQFGRPPPEPEPDPASWFAPGPRKRPGWMVQTEYDDDGPPPIWEQLAQEDELRPYPPHLRGSADGNGRG